MTYYAMTHDLHVTSVTLRKPCRDHMTCTYNLGLFSLLTQKMNSLVQRAHEKIKVCDCWIFTWINQVDSHPYLNMCHVTGVTIATCNFSGQWRSFSGTCDHNLSIDTKFDVPAQGCYETVFFRSWLMDYSSLWVFLTYFGLSASSSRSSQGHCVSIIPKVNSQSWSNMGYL